MGADEPQFLEVGEGRKRRRIAYRLADGAQGGAGASVAAGLPVRHGEHQGAGAGRLGARRRDCPCSASTIRATGDRTGDLLQASVGDWLEEASAMLGLARRQAARDPGRLVDGRMGRAAARPQARASRPRSNGSPGWC